MSNTTAIKNFVPKQNNHIDTPFHNNSKTSLKHTQKSRSKSKERNIQQFEEKKAKTKVKKDKLESNELQKSLESKNNTNSEKIIIKDNNPEPSEDKVMDAQYGEIKSVSKDGDTVRVSDNGDKQLNEGHVVRMPKDENKLPEAKTIFADETVVIKPEIPVPKDEDSSGLESYSDKQLDELFKRGDINGDDYTLELEKRNIRESNERARELIEEEIKDKIEKDSQENESSSEDNLSKTMISLDSIRQSAENTFYSIDITVSGDASDKLSARTKMDTISKLDKLNSPDDKQHTKDRQKAALKKALEKVKIKISE